jgi:hypothetical protein
VLLTVTPIRRLNHILEEFIPFTKKKFVVLFDGRKEERKKETEKEKKKLITDKKQT